MSSVVQGSVLGPVLSSSFNDTGSEIRHTLNFPYRAESGQIRSGGFTHYIFANLLENFPKFNSIFQIIFHTNLF